MSFKINKKSILMEENDQGRVVPKLIEGKNSLLVKVNLLNEYVKDFHYSENKGEEANKKGIIHNGKPLTKANISFLVPQNAVDLSEGDKATIRLNQDEWTVPSVRVDLGPNGEQTEDGKNKHDFLDVYSVPLKDVVDGMYQKPFRIRMSENMVQQPKDKNYAFVSFIEDDTKKQFLVSSHSVKQSPLDSRYGNVEVSIYPNNEYAVSSVVRSEEKDENGKSLYQVEPEGNKIAGSKLFSRIEASKERYKEELEQQKQKEQSTEQVTPETPTIEQTITEDSWSQVEDTPIDEEEMEIE